MSTARPHRKKVKHFHQPGDLHELTFSCYRRMKLLTNNPWRAKLSRSIDEACQVVGCFLAAFVYMPEHVHLLVWGITAEKDLSQLLSRVKQPVSVQVHTDLAQRHSRLLPRLMVRDRPGRQVFRFWQEGPGFDRNLFTVKAVQAAIDYIHNNPVARGLCQKARDWRWSSARFYESDGTILDPLLPKITPLPAEFWHGP
jgi:REP-associated tyrosine transposase